jgi:hypothetical protein
MKARGSGGIAPLFLTSGLDGGKWSTIRFFRFTLGEIISGIPWIGGWVGLRVGIDAVEK